MRKNCFLFIIFCIALLIFGCNITAHTPAKSEANKINHLHSFQQQIYNLDNSFVNYNTSSTSQFALKKLFVVGELSETYGATKVVSGYKNYNVLYYETEEQTEIAYNNLKLNPMLDVCIDEIASGFSYYDKVYSYSSYKSWGAKACDIGGINEYLANNSVTKEVAVVVIDSGINTSHEMFTNRFLYDENKQIVGYSFIGTNYTYSGYSFEDDLGHGTHVAGIICDLTPSNVKIIPIKVINSNNKASSSNIIMALDMICEQYSEQYHIVGVNLSLGGDYNESVFKHYENSFQALKEKNIICSVAAGNDFTNTSKKIPAACETPIVVSALANKDVLYGDTNFGYCFDTNYSNYGTSVDISAPGTRISSAYISSTNSKNSTRYTTLQGTSMATPHVTACIALLCLDPIYYDTNNLPIYTANQIESRLKENAIDFGDVGVDNKYGHGILNLRFFESVKDTSVSISLCMDGLKLKPNTYYSCSYTFDMVITCSDPSFKVYYGTNTNIPSTTADLPYESSFEVKNIGTVFAIAYKIENGILIRSEVFSAQFVGNFNKRHSITATSTENGAISPSGTSKVKPNFSITFTFSPNEGYYVKEIIVDGSTISENDLLTAIESGYTFKSVTTNHTIHVIFAISTYSVFAESVGNGTISNAGETMHVYGSSITYLFTPFAEHEVESILIDNEPLNASALTEAINNGYTFSNISSNHTICVVFSIKKYTINASSNNLGTISPSGIIKVNSGNSCNFSFTPQTGAYVSNIYVNNISLSPQELNNAIANGYQFTNVLFNQTIMAEFSLFVYTATMQTGGNGEIVCSKNELKYGDNVTFSFIPKTGYHLESLLVNGQNVSNIEQIAQSGLNISSITENYTLIATFAINKYTISIQPLKFGKITIKNNLNLIEHGKKVELIVTPNEGYYLSILYVNNSEEINPGNNIVLDVYSNLIINAVFDVKPPNFENSIIAIGIVCGIVLIISLAVFLILKHTKKSPYPNNNLYVKQQEKQNQHNFLNNYNTTKTQQKNSFDQKQEKIVTPTLSNEDIIKIINNVSNNSGGKKTPPQKPKI